MYFHSPDTETHNPAAAASFVPERHRLSDVERTHGITQSRPDGRATMRGYNDSFPASTVVLDGRQSLIFGRLATGPAGERKEKS